MVRDWRGNELLVGDHIVWPVRSGSDMWVSEGVIDEIGVAFEGKAYLKVSRLRESTFDYFGDGRVKQAKTTISVINRVTKVEA